MEQRLEKTKTDTGQQREGFSTGLGVFFATLGSAVGLGNIWKFPYVVGANGGGAFLLIYLLCLIFVGLPVVICEFYIGRTAKKNVVGAVKSFKKNKLWGAIGVFSLISSYLILFFYTSVAGWVYSYVFKGLTGQFSGISAENAGKVFGDTITGPYAPVIWQLVVLGVVGSIIALGVQKGIEKMTKTLMPVLFIFIIVCVIKSLTLPGAMDGVKFLFSVNFQDVTTKGILLALGLAFFKLGIGLGAMVTYSSYFTKDTDMIGTAAKVAFSDTFISILAGLAIFPAVFSFGMKPGQGPGLLFNTMPLVFSKMPFGSILLVLFFALTAIAATTAMISMLEVLIAYFVEERGFSRVKAVVINIAIIAVFGFFATLSASEGALFGKVVTPLFHKSIFDTFDFIAENMLMPFTGLIIILFVGYTVKKSDVLAELSNHGNLKNAKIIGLFYNIMKYITPVLLVILLITGLMPTK